MSGNLRYIYAVVPAAACSAIASAGIRGIEGAPVEPIHEGALGGATSALGASDYDEAPLNARMQDLDWLAPRAAAHQEVNARLLDISDTLVPLAFGAIYRDEAGVRAMLRTRASELDERLSQLAGRAEWIVSVERDESAEPESEALGELEREIAAAPPGRAFLLGKRREDVLRTERRERDAAIALATERAIGDSTERIYREPLVEDQAVPVIARFSVLTPRASEGQLRAAMDALARAEAVRGYHIRLSGPWPAYRFGGLPLERVAS